MQEKTVAAISTPKGEGGISIIRISGNDAIAIAERCFRSASGKALSALKGYEAAFGAVFFEDKKIDDAVALIFRAPKSYTGEDTVELSVHGGIAASEATLRAVISCGAAAASAGEFTKRAFLNGKLDLAEAESVMGLISAKNETALRISLAAKDGRISREISEIRAELLSLAAAVSYYSDYPDEELPEANEAVFKEKLRICEERLSLLISNFDNARAIKEGIDCVIAGRPNVGKSTLMNMLSGYERSIVTDIAGTTRDVIESTVRLGRVTINLADTAGIRSSEDIVETAGVDLAKRRMSSAQIVLAVFDASRSLDAEDLALLDGLLKDRTLIILNKTDLQKRLSAADFEGFNSIEISAKENLGISKLQSAIEELCGSKWLDLNDAFLASERQRGCAAVAAAAVKNAQNALNEGVTVDAVGVLIDDALLSLFELTGERVTNEVCDEVFRNFCVGK